jgi:hypothetical protein
MVTMNERLKIKGDKPIQRQKSKIQLNSRDKARNNRGHKTKLIKREAYAAIIKRCKFI